MIGARGQAALKFRRRGVKREHSILADFAAAFERVAALPAVEGVIPGRIAQNPTAHPGLVLKTETTTGFKLLAKTRESVQEVFVIVRRGQRDQAFAALSAMSTRPTGPTAAPRSEARRRKSRPTPPAGRGGSGVVPAARWQGQLVRYAAGTPPADWAPATASLLATGGDPALRRRLWTLRLRRARWRQRFGSPLRRVGRPRRRAR